MSAWSHAGGDHGDRRLERDRAAERERMVRDQLEARGRNIRDAGVLRVMRTVPRHRFVPASGQAEAYADHPIPIGHQQTISQPFIVALMLEQLDLRPHHRVLEIGTGSGYVTALLAELVHQVYSLELIPSLARRARYVLTSLGYRNVRVRIGDGHEGWPEAAPFDGIAVACAPENIPTTLVGQLTDGGRLVVPVGGRDGQELLLLEKRGHRIGHRALSSVRFVPMVRRLPDRPGSVAPPPESAADWTGQDLPEDIVPDGGA